MTTKTARRRLVGGFALSALAGAIASCGGTVRDSLGDSDPNSGGATSILTPGTGSGGGSKATGAGGKSSGSGTVGAGAVTGTAGKSTGGGTLGSGGKSGGGGTVGIGGKAGGAGTIATGGKSASGGKAGTGAVPAAGGVAVDPCAGVRCQQTICPDGTLPSVPPGACCPVCTPKCELVDCGIPKCGPNQVATTFPGQCCPTCVLSGVQQPDAGAPCDVVGYRTFRKELEQKYSTASCMLDSECVITAMNVCGTPDCGIALTIGLYGSFESNLASYAAASCTGCGPVLVTCPATTPTARCLNGACAVVRQ
jgi:hypothetical protein